MMPSIVYNLVDFRVSHPSRDLRGRHADAQCRLHG